MKKIAVILAALIFAASFAYAAECNICANMKSDDASKCWGSRLGNGLCNLLLGWSEIFYRPGKVVAEGGNGLVGFFRGVGNALTRTGIGAVEVVTFWTPGATVCQMSDCPLCAFKK